MREITASGQTIEEAVASALKQLDLTKDQVETEVIDEGKKGFLGIFGSALAVVKVTEKQDVIEETADYLIEVTKHMGVDVKVETTTEDKHITYELTGEKLGLLIGKRGKTLNALQYLANLVLNRTGNRYYSVTVDAEGYRARRRDTLEELAFKMMEKALRIKGKVALEPMPAYERKIIHSALQKKTDISTYSDGKEPHRHIVIQPEK